MLDGGALGGGEAGFYIHDWLGDDAAVTVELAGDVEGVSAVRTGLRCGHDPLDAARALDGEPISQSVIKAGLGGASNYAVAQSKGKSVAARKRALRC